MVRIGDFSIIDDYLAKTSVDIATINSASEPPRIESQPSRDFYIQEASDLMHLYVALCDWVGHANTQKSILASVVLVDRDWDDSWNESWIKSWNKRITANCSQ